MKNNIDIICTLGPASLNDKVISRLEELGVTLFRINMSHTKVSDLREIIAYVQRQTRVPLCLDSEGAQIRTGTIADGSVMLREHAIIHAYDDYIVGDSEKINFYPQGITNKLEIGDLVSIDFNAALVQVIAKKPGEVTLCVLNGGQMGQNKAVSVHRKITLPALTDKDREAISIGVDMSIRHFALSFANSAKDIAEFRDNCGQEIFLISKIECQNGLINLDEIIEHSDAILIDRGDLSREVPIERIPSLQKTIISHANNVGKPVYVATNLLESMIDEPGPSRAEVNDVFHTLNSGANGLVLAAETAIGSHPIECGSMIVKLIREFETEASDKLNNYQEDFMSLLVEPHGGHLVHREVLPDDMADIDRHVRIAVSDLDLMDCEQIAYGTYSPLTGFMDRETLEGVLNENCLPSGISWTMPIVLQLSQKKVERITEGDRVVLTNQDGKPYAFLDITEIYKVNLNEVAKKWFGTDSGSHPGLARFKGHGNLFVAGEVSLIERVTNISHYNSLLPSQTRFIFSHKRWSKVVGFHTRNVPHRAHEYIQLSALEATHADGLFISPVVGPKKEGDYLAKPIIGSYERLIRSGVYPEGKVALGSFLTYSRYCGPREAIFTALCRKNMGCSHFLIGRDHTGVGNFYNKNGNRELFDKLGDIGIEPVFFDEIGYNPQHKTYESINSGNSVKSISGTEIREAIRSNKSLPEWVIRKSTLDYLKESLGNNNEIFYQKQLEDFKKNR